MKAIQLEEPGQFRRIDAPEPDAPGPGEALVRTHRMGVCGTDISGYLGKMPFFQYPRIPGHELGVEVLEISDGVENVQPGDRCSVEPYMHCGECLACRKGHTNCCENLKVIGVMIDGGLCDRFVLRADKLHPSTELSFDQLALVETLGIGCHAVDRAEPTQDETALVIGAGPIGLAAMEFTKLGAGRTVVMDLAEHRLNFCRESMNVDAAIQPADDLEQTRQRLREACGGELPDIVIDATGAAGSMSQALNYCASTGRLVYVGITTDEVHFPHPVMHKPELTLLASRNALPNDFTRIIKLIETGRINTAPWITHRTHFEDMIDTFPDYTKPETGVVKAVIEVQD